MARAYPAATFTGSDYHEGSVRQARARIADAGLDGRVSFEVASAQDFAGGPYDLVTSFDCLHDMGDPLGAARHVREQLAPEGTWMVVEPAAGGSVAENLNPVGRVYYSFSTFLCVPSALAQEGGYSLGAQAGEAAIAKLAADAGLHPLPPRRGDAVQYRLRSPAVGAWLGGLASAAAVAGLSPRRPRRPGSGDRLETCFEGDQRLARQYDRGHGSQERLS